MRVLQVNVLRDPERRRAGALLDAWPTLGGVASAVAAAGARVTVLQLAHVSETHERGGAEIRFVRSWPELLRRARDLEPDVLHLHGLGFPLPARVLAAALPAAPLLAQDHADRVPPPWRRPLHRWGHAATAGAAFTARQQAEPFLAAGVLRRDMPVFEVVESSTHFTPGDRAEARAATGLGGTPCVLWVGRLAPVKDPLVMLEAFARVARELPDARLWCAYGEAPLLAAVEARIAGDPLLRERVRLLGRIPHERVEPLCRAADLFVSSSLREGSGYAVIEAMACGAPVAATDIPSFRRLVGDTGALAPTGDAAALAKAMLDVARREPAAARAAARARFEAELSFDALGRQLIGAYEALLARGHR